MASPLLIEVFEQSKRVNNFVGVVDDVGRAVCWSPPVVRPNSIDTVAGRTAPPDRCNRHKVNAVFTSMSSSVEVKIP